MADFLSYFAVKQPSDTVYHEDAKLALQEKGQSSAFVSADSTWAPVSAASPVLAGNTGSESSKGPLGPSLSNAEVLQPGAFLQEGSLQSESIRRRLHQASLSSDAAGSSFILVCT